jgi:hypothetical protein
VSRVQRDGFLRPYSRFARPLSTFYKIHNLRSNSEGEQSGRSNPSSCRKYEVSIFFWFLGMRLSPLGTSATIWPLVSALDDG